MWVLESMSRQANQWDPLSPAQVIPGKSIHCVGLDGRNLEPGTLFVAGAEVKALSHWEPFWVSDGGVDGAGAGADVDGIRIL